MEEEREGWKQILGETHPPPLPKEKKREIYTAPSIILCSTVFDCNYCIATFWVKRADFTNCWRMRACSWSVALQTVREQGLESESVLYTLIMHSTQSSRYGLNGGEAQ